uniref:DUF7083 domain-containing protein n=1 Tax=Heligmosomoides polygyrus TaxID=6339 RepID=A0A183G2J4_HELPZ
LQSQQPTSSTVEPERHSDLIAGRIEQFSYNSEANLTFEAWFRRHEDIFQVDGQTLDEATRIRLLLHMLYATAYEKYSSYILPKTPRDSSNDAFVRLKLLDKIETDPKCAIQTLTEECKRLLNLKHVTKTIEAGSTRRQAVKRSTPHQPGRHQQQLSSALLQQTAIKKGDIDSKRTPKLLLHHAGSVEQCTSFATATTINIDATTATGVVTKADSADKPHVEQSSLDPIAQRGKPHAPTQTVSPSDSKSTAFRMS